MKQSKIINAYKVLQQISAQPLPLPAAYKLHKLKTALQPQWDFQVNEEQKAISENGGTINPFGLLQFADDPPAGVEADETNDYGKGREKFEAKLTELADLEVEVEYKPVKLDGKGNSLKLSINDLSALEGFVEISFE